MNTVEWMGIADAVGAWLLTYLLHSTALLLPALLLSRVLGMRRLSLQESVLRVALLGALMTASLQVGMGWEATTGSIPYPSARLMSAPVEVGSPAHSADVALVRSDRGPTRGDRSADVTAAPSMIDSRAIGLTLAVGLWGAVGLFLIARLALMVARLRRWLRRRTDVESGSVFRLFWRLLALSDVDKPTRLTRSNRLDVPIALGMGQREICLPDRVVDELPQEQQETVLAHELAHIERHDPAWLLLARALESLLFVQPLNRIARRKLQEIAEYRCDDWAAKQTGHPLTLAKCLTAVATWSVDRRLAGLAPTMAGRPSGLGQRVRRLLDPKYSGLDTRMPSWWRPLAGVGLILVLVAVPGFSVVDQEVAPEAPAADSVAEPASAPVAEPVPESSSAEVVRPDLIAGVAPVVPEAPPALAPMMSASPKMPVTAIVAPSVAPQAPVLAVPRADPAPEAAPTPVVDSEEIKVDVVVARRVIPVAVRAPTRVASRIVVRNKVAVEARVKLALESGQTSEPGGQDADDQDGEDEVDWEDDFEEDLEHEMEALEDEIDSIVDEMEDAFDFEIDSVVDAIEDELEMIEEEIEATIEAELELFEDELETQLEIFEDEMEVLEEQLEERFENSDSEAQEERLEAELEKIEDHFDNLSDRLDGQLTRIEDRLEQQLENILDPIFEDGEFESRLEEIEERVGREADRMAEEMERAFREAQRQGEHGLTAEARDRLIEEARRLAEAARPTSEEIEALQAAAARLAAVRPSPEELKRLREAMSQEMEALRVLAEEGLAQSRSELQRLGQDDSRR